MILMINLKQVFYFHVEKKTFRHLITILKLHIFDVQMYCDVIYTQNVQIMTS